MTEAEWNTSSSPQPMLDYLLTGRPEAGDELESRPSGIGYRPTGGPLPCCTERKLRLWACSACRNYMGPVDIPDLAFTLNSIAMQPCRNCLPPATQAALLREVCGNPWRQLNTDERGWVKDKPSLDKALAMQQWLRWNDRTVPRMAQGIYDDRAWGRMPMLADALLDAGCDDEDLLQHCRGLERCSLCAFAAEQGDAPIWCGECKDARGWRPAGPHVRGCFALDLILGKS